MGSAIGQSLPVAVGILISPIPIVAIILMLVTPKARSNGFAFLLGWFATILVVGGLLVLLAGAAVSGSGSTPAWVNWVKIVLGVLSLLVALKEWRGRPRGDAEPVTPKWMSAVDKFKPLTSMGLAAALVAINPKNLLLLVSGAATIAGATSSTTDRLVAMLVFAVVASIGVAAPMGMYVAMGARAAEALADLRSWLIRNNSAVMAILMLVIGVKLLGDGVSGL